MRSLSARYVGPLDFLDRRTEAVGVALVNGVARQIDDHTSSVRLDNIEGYYGTARNPNCPGDSTDSDELIELHANRDRIRGAGNAHCVTRPCAHCSSAC